jgi:hypothetical protein
MVFVGYRRERYLRCNVTDLGVGFLSILDNSETITLPGGNSSSQATVAVNTLCQRGAVPSASYIADILAINGLGVNIRCSN